MTSSLHAKIPIVEAPNKILEIVCSPNLKHVATLDEDSYISLLSVVGQEIPLMKVKKKISAIFTQIYLMKKYLLFLIINVFQLALIESNLIISVSYAYNKFITIFARKLDSLIVLMHIFQEIFDFENEQEVLLTFPDRQKEVHFLSFIDDGSIVMVNALYCRAYAFSGKGKDNISWICKSMIELKYFNKIYITYWDYITEHIEISDDEELLIIYARNEKAKDANKKHV
ncbi:20947_t:CDS:2, partial [Dentiscutata erythropus]